MAVELGWSHAAVQALTHDEYIRWRAYMTWREAQRQHQADVAAARSKR